MEMFMLMVAKAVVGWGLVPIWALLPPTFTSSLRDLSGTPTVGGLCVR
jgi:hypothetical protein